MKKVIRIITLAPIMAFVALSILYFSRPDIFQGPINYIISILFLTVLPLVAYPLQPFVPGFKDQGRAGQRKLAIVSAVSGYVLGMIYAVIAKTSKNLLFIYLIYLLSGIMIFITNKIIKIKASGHACGVVGPIVYLWHFIGSYALIGIILLVIVCWASVKMKRHTLSEFFLGSIIPLFSFYISNIICF